MRKIAIVTGTRAEYGLLYWIIKGIHEDTELELLLIVTGTHLSPEFGLTVEEIEKDRFPIAERVEMLVSSDSELAIATSMGLGMIGFAKAYERLNPDILLVLGDRFEILSAVSAAIPFRIPVAHVHGGEISEGAMDELFRHAITKMSYFHFTSTEFYAKRIKQMGEEPGRIFCLGAPGLDNVYKLNLLERQELALELGLQSNAKWGIVTYHPVTLEKEMAKIHIEKILNALKKFTEIFWVFTIPNADTEGRIIKRSIEAYVENNFNKARLFSSLGQLKYLSMLRNVVVMVGNSSSGIIEAPSFELPVVNIGNRQKGRVKAKNVIDVPLCEEDKIVTAIRKAISMEFKDSLKGLRNPYSCGIETSGKIIEILKKVSLSNKCKKTFFELDVGNNNNGKS